MDMKNNNGPKIIVALDVPGLKEVLTIVEHLSPQFCRVKVGKELFTAVGPSVVEELQEMGFEVFLDLKLHDIPNTVAQTCKVIGGMGVWMTNVHALGGRKMMEAAVDAVANFKQPPKLIAVTVLTSMDANDLDEVGVPKENVLLPVEYFLKPASERTPPLPTTISQVERLARLADQSGMNGVVCSAQEVQALRAIYKTDFDLVTPGIRLPDGNADDQKRIMTPEKAIALGSDYLVIGRPITGAPDPAAALLGIHQCICSV